MSKTLLTISMSCLAPLVILSCTDQGSYSPEGAVTAFALASNRTDFQAAETRMTPRLEDRVEPESFKEFWLANQIIGIVSSTQVGDTAEVEIDLSVTPDRLSVYSGLTPNQIREWLVDPPLAAANFKDSAQLLSSFQIYEDSLVNRWKFTLYRKDNLWQIEFLEPVTINEAMLAAAPLTGPEEPFTLAGLVRSIEPAESDRIGVNILTSSPNLERYQEGWVSVSMAEIDRVLSPQGDPIDWTEIEAGESISISGTVKFAAEVDASGRLPASIRAREIEVLE